MQTLWARSWRDFNPRLPRGRRRGKSIRLGTRQGFQSTPPSREATKVNLTLAFYLLISIHASLAGGDI